MHAELALFQRLRTDKDDTQSKHGLVTEYRGWHWNEHNKCAAFINALKNKKRKSQKLMKTNQKQRNNYVNQYN